MNPDVFITIVFVGIVFSVLLVSLVVVLPQVRRGDAAVERRESRLSNGTQDATLATTRRSAEKGGRDAAVH